MKPMLMYVVAAALLLLGAIPIYGRNDGLTNPHAILGVAVAKSRMYDKYKYEVRKTNLNNPGTKESEPLDNNENDVAQKISLPILFRVGRFQLSRSDDEVTREGLQAIVIKFSPQGEKILRLKPEKGGDPTYNRGMNNLAGKVFIDPATGSIMRAEGWLTEGISFRWKFIPGGRIEKLDFEFIQERRGRKWIPSEMTITVKVSFLVFEIAHRRYWVVFRCD